MPGAVAADAQTPEALIETLAKRPRQSSTLYVDEFAELLTKIEKQQYMAGLKPLPAHPLRRQLLHRTATQQKNDSQKTEDADVDRRPHLCLIGAATPMLFHRINAEDVLNGISCRASPLCGRRANRPVARSTKLASDVDLDAATSWTGCRTSGRWASKTERPGTVSIGRRWNSSTDSRSASSATPRATGKNTPKIMLQRLMPMCLEARPCAGAAGRIDTLSQHTLLVTTGALTPR